MSGPTDPTEAHFDKGLWGFDGTVWRKLPLLFGYSDTVCERVIEAGVDAGDEAVTLTPVPAGMIYVIGSIGVRNSISATPSVSIQGYKQSVIFTLVEIYPLDAGRAGVWTGSLVLKEGDYVYAYFVGCTAGDDLYLGYEGYSMAIAE